MISTIYVPDHYPGDGVEDTFAFSWRILAKTDLVVLTKVIATGVVATLVLDTDFTVDDADVDTDDGGVIVLVDPATDLPTGTSIYILRHTARTQLVNLEEGLGFTPALVMKALDRLTMIAQEQDEELSRALKFGQVSSYDDIDVPDPQADKVLGWNATADDLDNLTN